ncbi:MAG: hypothetical protein Solivirus7_5 [Solivirus sp.]|uniref:Uncharacterized protein n=1 Tax=Solivirus sp. TaxID=2487772 RepID=A0A3G5AG14_9VIRU|nr:MAG: hypothetical protein Solivirus7_5 [Solivirus sp.]
MANAGFRFRLYVVLQVPKGTKEFHREYNKKFLKNRRYEKDHVISFDLYIHDEMNEQDCYKSLIEEIVGYKLKNFRFFTVNEKNTVYTEISKEDVGAWIWIDPIRTDNKEQMKKLYICTKREHIPNTPEMIQKLSTEYNHSSSAYNSETNTLISEEELINLLSNSSAEVVVHDDDGNEINLRECLN